MLDIEDYHMFECIFLNLMYNLFYMMYNLFCELYS